LPAAAWPPGHLAQPTAGLPPHASIAPKEATGTRPVAAGPAPLPSLREAGRVRAWVVHEPGPAGGSPLRLVERELPEPGPGQVRVRLRCCGVCRTDLHLAEGDLAPKRPDVVPGHEVVGVVDAAAAGVSRFAPGDRVGVAWLGGTDGTCRFCRRGAENLCLRPSFTGWDADGGYAEACLVGEEYAYRLPDALTDEQAAPLLCAGIIGYRALRAAAVAPGGSLGIYGFGASAHLAAQLALHEGLRVHVLTRGAGNQDLARRLGVDSVGPADAAPPEPLDGAVLFAPAGSPWPGSGCPTSRRSTTAPSCSRSGGCGRSPRTPAPTASSSSRSPPGTGSSRRPCPTRSSGPTRRCATCRPGRTQALPCSKCDGRAPVRPNGHIFHKTLCPIDNAARMR
jgi:propanol-preferring alcohol dehydrogenase